MNELQNCLDKLRSENNETKKAVTLKKLYRILAQINVKDDVDIFDNIIIPKLRQLLLDDKVNVEHLYLSFIANENLNVVKRWLIYEKSNVELNLANHKLLFNYCFHKNKHWLVEVINSDNAAYIFPRNVFNVIEILKLIAISNEVPLDVEKIKSSLNEIEYSKTEATFSNFYVKEQKRVLNVLSIYHKYVSTSEEKLLNVYSFASKHTLLETFSRFLNLDCPDTCDDILQRLKEYHCTDEYEILISYIVLFNILYCLKCCKTVSQFTTQDEISHIIKQTETKLVNLKNLKLQVELLENIFAFLFLKCADVLCNDNPDFFCSENEVRLLLMFLKSASDEITRTNPFDKSSEEFKRFTELNRYLVDALWRLELLISPGYEDSTKNKIKRNTLFYMLAPAESLIHLCLKQNDFEKVGQVIQIFNLNSSKISAEIVHSKNLLNVKEKLANTFKFCRIKSIESTNAASQNIQTIIEDFFAEAHEMHEFLDLENSKFIDTLDLAITQSSTFEECDTLFKMLACFDCAKNAEYLSFYRKLENIFNEINNNYSLSIRDILCSPEHSLDVDRYKAEKSFYSQLSSLCDVFNKQVTEGNIGKLNFKHSSHRSFLKLQDLCLTYENNLKDNVKYLQKLMNYLRCFAKVFYINNDNSDVISMGRDASLFSIFTMSRAEILEKLLFQKKLDISEFEQLFNKLKLDLAYHVARIFFPTVELNFNNKNAYQKPFHLPNKDIISYIQRRNWLLAFILNKMYKMEETALDLNEVRIQTFTNYIHLPTIQNIKVLFNGNEVVTSLFQHYSPEQIELYFEQHIIKPEETLQQSLMSQYSMESLETGEEISEEDLKITNWKHLFDVINNVPLNQLRNSEKLLDLRDMVLTEIVSDCFEPDFFRYVQFIYNDKLRWECILNNITTWPGEFCLHILKGELSRFSEIDCDIQNKFCNWCTRIELYESIKNILQKNSWFEIYVLCKNKHMEVLQSLLNTVEVELLISFLEIHKVTEDVLKIIDESYFMALFDSNIEFLKIAELLHKLPQIQAVTVCYNLLKLLKKLDHLEFITTFISKLNLNDNSMFYIIKISLKILACCNANEQEQLWCLITDPFSMIEIFIMNTKLERLGQILEVIKPDIENFEFDVENEISIERLDEILRAYAEKSLEFRVMLQPGARLVKTPESSKLMQSLDSMNFPCGRKYFEMPKTVPDKSEWVQNHEVTDCMCCNETTFSMFNRRHHCRRCGRVICGTCSLKKMLVPTYGDIRVRVCLDCYEQTYQENGTSSSKSETSTKSIGCDYWLLTNDPNHNQIVRDEFSFEYAPSVSLCLAIMKHHSKNEEYKKFLIEQCNDMLTLLQSVNADAAQEIDYLLVIKMLKSLAIAAKMVSGQWGSSTADQILSQADLLGLLAERGCLHLLPSCNHSYKDIPDQYINANTLRRLRDKLLEMEQWNLALEVSTKAGLDNSGVFAAWGKSYLKAGSLQLAREKFQRCFDRMAHYETSTELSDSYSTSQPSLQFRQRSLLMSENRPSKNPPLLNEIVQILESNTSVIDKKILNDVKNIKPLSSSSWSLNSSVNLPLQIDPAICILNKLKNLSSIVAGNYCMVSDTGSDRSVNVDKPHLETIFYEECIYYLSKYGTRMSLLEFYIKHGDMYECLKYMIHNQLSSDIFIDVYLLCLKNNHVDVLHENMSKIDSTLDVWKNYLRSICRHLEKNAQLHSLYQLQQFMGDFVRAAMTCIKFYKEGATTYTELISRVDYLQRAQQHLQQEVEQEQWVEVATVRKSSLDSQESFEAKGIANPSLVMKMDSKHIDRHIKTLGMQIEVAKFLANCESNTIPVLQILPEILPFINEDLPPDEVNKIKLPTLFGSYYERVQLAVLAIVYGENIDSGFEIAFKIIQDYKLNSVKVFCHAGKQLAKTERYSGIAQLVNCIRSTGISDSAVKDMCDEMLILAVQTLTKANVSGPELDGLIKLITDRAAKISAYIESKQLKSAYLLAVKNKRMGDIRRILREAELLNQQNIKALCQKILHAHSHSPSHTKD